MEIQYYTIAQKQDFYEIIQNKYGELAVFIDSRPGSPINPILEFDDQKTALLKRDDHLAVCLDDINPETAEILKKSTLLMVIELTGEIVERVYGVFIHHVKEIIFSGHRRRADEIIRPKSRADIIKSFGAVKSWTGGSQK